MSDLTILRLPPVAFYLLDHHVLKLILKFSFDVALYFVMSCDLDIKVLSWEYKYPDVIQY